MDTDRWPRAPRFAWFIWCLGIVAVGTASGLGMSDGAAFAGVMVLTLFAVVFWAIPESMR